MEIAKNIIAEYRRAPEKSKLYLGVDSTRFERGGQAFARISIVAVIHLGSSKGCKVIGYNETERVYDKNLSKPMHRMMLETYEVSKLYRELEGHIPDIEVHLDISADVRYGSSCAAKQASGYILGMCQVTPVLKPHAWAASTCADLFNKKLNKKVVDS